MSHRIPGMTAPAPIQARMTGASVWGGSRVVRGQPPPTGGGQKRTRALVHCALNNPPPRSILGVNGGFDDVA